MTTKSLGSDSDAAPVEHAEPLLGEVALLDDVGPPRSVRYRPLSWTGLAWLTPTLLLLGLVAAWPVLRTAHAALFDGWRPSGDRLAEAFADPLTPRAVLLTVAWTVIVPFAVVLLGYLLAAASRRTRLGLLGTAVLVAPMALSMAVTGITFRLLYDPNPERGGATYLVGQALAPLDGEPPAWLGPSMITVSLMTAFVWAWVGIAVVVFRAALDGIPHQIIDAARAEGANNWDLLATVQLPMLRRVAALLLALIAVATSRSFDLLLVTAPGSVRDDAIVLPVHLWQSTGEHHASALGLVWLLIVAAGVLLASLGARQHWPLPIRLPDPEPWRRPRRRAGSSARPTGQPGRRRRRSITRTPQERISGLIVALAILVWAFPLVMLAATALRAPVDAATTSWAAPVSADSFRTLFAETEMLAAIARTAVLATVVTAVVLVVATLGAYALVWLRQPGRRGLVVAALLAAAVVPVQIVVGPVDQALSVLGLSSTPAGLALVHIGLGLPLAVLLLRQAFAAAPVERIQRARLHARGEGYILRGVVLPAAKPSLIAVAALQFVQVWNDLVVALLTAAPEATPVGPLLFTETRQFSSSAGVLAAGAVVVSAVPLVIVILARRHIVTALVSGVVRR